MKSSSPEALVEVLRRHLPSGHVFDPGPGLGERLAEALGAARTAWPGLALPDDAFLGFLAERLPEGAPLSEALERMHVPDLYLACGCAQGDAAALGCFERDFVPDLRRVVLRAGFAPGMMADVEQLLRLRLLVDGESGSAKIGQYRGQGALRSWVRVVALREALMMLREHRGQVRRESERMPEAVSEDFELQFVKRRYRDEFAAAFREAMGTLDNRQRNLLRYHYLDGLTLEQVGNIYGVHRATVARWIAQARGDLMARLRAGLQERLGVATGEIESLVRALDSQVEITLPRLLATQAPEGDS